MKYTFLLLAGSLSLLLSCNTNTNTQPAATLRLNGTWRLISGASIAKGDTTVTDYTKNSRMIKIINDDHFAFLKHDLNSPKDSSNHFDAGGGAYTLEGNKYTEHLDYYNDRNWEGKTFQFTVAIDNDTLIQKGLEKVESEGVDHEIIERYVREK
jgi:hypothetical protein